MKALLSLLFLTLTAFWTTRTQTTGSPGADIIKLEVENTNASQAYNIRKSRGIFGCKDRGCASLGGSCGRGHAACLSKPSGKCKGLFCSCCIPCSGTCSGGYCRTSCYSSEESSGKCGNSCKCCKKKLVCNGNCGNGGTCKLSCNPKLEVEASTNWCASGCKCCEPADPHCDQKCGRRNKFFCRKKNSCSFFNWRIGSCPSGCRCCRK